MIVTITLGQSDCQMRFDVTSAGPEHVPSKEGWQLLIRLESVSCYEQLLPETDRYTYTRVGEADCDSTSTVRT
ncbi:MAG: hypothetical protein AB1752_02395 [Candidatus Zixiibacteriota bacterium]